MSQKGLIYSFVAKGTVVLAEHTPYSGNFSTIAVQCLQKLPHNSSKYTYSCDGHTFNFLIDSGFVFLVVADESTGRSVPFLFLERVKDDFKKCYGASIGDGSHPLADDDEDDLFEDRFSIAYNLDREFGTMPRVRGKGSRWETSRNEPGRVRVTRQHLVNEHIDEPLSDQPGGGNISSSQELDDDTALEALLLQKVVASLDMIQSPQSIGEVVVRIELREHLRMLIRGYQLLFTGTRR